MVLCHLANVLQALNGWVHKYLQVSVGGIAHLAAALAVEVQRDVLCVIDAAFHVATTLAARHIDGKSGHVLNATVGILQTLTQSTEQSFRVEKFLVHVAVHLIHVLLVLVYLLQRREAGLGTLGHELIEVLLSLAHLSCRLLLCSGFLVPLHQRKHPCRSS